MAVVDSAALDDHPAEAHHKPGGISSSLLGMVLFIASEVMFFGGLFGAYFTIRSSHTQWPPEGTEAHLETWYAAILTAILVTSSVTMQLGVWAIRRNDQRKLILWLAVSMLLGIAFLCGQGYEYSKLISEGMTLSSGVFGSTFFTLTGFHGAHVAGGAAFILITLLRARSGQFTARYHDTVEMASYYWHFVDVVWLGLFSTIYLLR
jgi:cytochrome c oxidase subunit III